jgi:S-adenosylmethionine synthetase
MKLFSTEQVSKWHPDKYADQISDAILDHCLRWDKNAKVAVETLVKGTTVVLAGEITAQVTYESIKDVVHRVADKLGYKVDKIINLIEKQSTEIANAVIQNDGSVAAGDQGIMFGYATTESNSLLPYGFDLANRVISVIEDDVDYNKASILKGDAKVQVTVDFEKQPEESLHTLLISVCHKERLELADVQDYMKHLLEANDIPMPSEKLLINPAGVWTVGGPEADAGLTGRKIVCDQYGGYVPVGGGAFSGKDPSKVDRSGSYMARYLATKAIYKFADQGLRWIQIQLAYAIGVKEPVSVAYVSNVRGDEELEAAIKTYLETFDLTPTGIINHLQLVEKTNYERRAEGCHYYLHMTKSEME